MLKEGTMVGGRYEIISRIGSGGMADVYKARDHKLNRLVAVKVLKAEFREDRTFVSKFRSEAQAAAGLSHPNIVNVFDVGEDDEVYFIVMELVEGITLKEYITKKGQLSVREATSIAIQVSMGLEAAHNRGIVHRDVKPQNIIISTDGKVKLSDFGIARAASSNTISSNVMGSVHYSSPEQVRGGYSDSKSDIYSLGITIYEMVTGRVPFDGDTTVAIAIKHLQEEMEAPGKYVPNLPHSLEQIILKCTQKSVDRRYQFMSELIEDLKHSLLEPDGNFVKLAPLASHAQTVMVSQKEMEEIRQGISAEARRERQQQEENRYEDRRYNENRYENNDEDDEYDEDDDDDRISSKLEKAITIGGFVIVALIVGILIYFFAQGAGFLKPLGTSDKDKQQIQEEVDNGSEKEDDNTVKVPNLVGEDFARAEELVQKLNIGLKKVETRSSEEVKAGAIISTDPIAGTAVELHTTIHCVVSSGPDKNRVTVPTGLIGKTQSEVEAALLELGLLTEIKNEHSETYAVGKVISLTPGEGSSLKKEDTVTVVVSLGGENAKVPVPNVKGKTEEEAVKTLEGLGLVVDILYVRDENSTHGLVFYQDVKANTEVEPGTTVTLTVNKLEETTGTPTPTPDNGGTSAPPPDASQEQPTGDKGNWVTNQQLGKPDNLGEGPIKIELHQTVNGQEQVSVLVDGQVISNWPYRLDNLVGADNVSDGYIYLYIMENGNYQQECRYPVTFKPKSN